MRRNIKTFLGVPLFVLLAGKALVAQPPSENKNNSTPEPVSPHSAGVQHQAVQATPQTYGLIPMSYSTPVIYGYFQGHLGNPQFALPAMQYATPQSSIGFNRPSSVTFPVAASATPQTAPVGNFGVQAHSQMIPISQMSVVPQGASAGTGVSGGFTSPIRTNPPTPNTDAINKATLAVMLASTPEQKKAAEDKLKSALNDYFEMELAQRKANLNTFKKSLQDMEKQIQTRQSEKTEIIELQKKLIINETKGLGFYGLAIQ